MAAERLLPGEMILGECPVWDEGNNALYWIDITAGQLWRHGFLEEETTQVSFDQNIGACCLTRSGGVLVALEKSIVVLRDGHQQTLVEGIERELPHNRFNDGKCDSRGRLFIGTMHREAEKERASLYRLEPAGAMAKVLSPVTVSNGVAWSPDDRYLYYVDTPSGFLWRFAYDVETGTLSRRTPLIDYRNEEGDFDGICVDAEGCIWACHWGGFQVSRWDPRTQQKLLSIPLPVPNVTCCCFGGPGMNRLMITTGTGRDPRVKRDYPLSGSLYACEVDTVGLPSNRFGL
ncbi:MAG: SMP-30/gluconolactonase/LRE family protein [Candidatus Limiplasma sp.]|nr:SMP-30/gluconolactonase/LRE family protein [Candidatus Limiplasma sp.]